jgi:hypothetical protein
MVAQGASLVAAVGSYETHAPNIQWVSLFSQCPAAKT